MVGAKSSACLLVALLGTCPALQLGPALTTRRYPVAPLGRGRSCVRCSSQPDDESDLAASLNRKINSEGGKGAIWWKAGAQSLQAAVQQGASKVKRVALLPVNVLKEAGGWVSKKYHEHPKTAAVVGGVVAFNLVCKIFGLKIQLGQLSLNSMAGLGGGHMPTGGMGGGMMGGRRRMGRRSSFGSGGGGSGSDGDGGGGGGGDGGGGGRGRRASWWQRRGGAEDDGERRDGGRVDVEGRQPAA